MSDIRHNPSRSDQLLSQALRDLAHAAPQSASPEIKASLGRAFHRHRVRRRATRMAAVLAVTLTISGGSLWLHMARQRATQGAASYRSGPHLLAAENAAAVAEGEGNGQEFVALPAFAFARPEEELRVIRVEMPVSSLRLLGARVNDELATRRILADLLVGADGTPYAFRLIT